MVSGQVSIQTFTYNQHIQMTAVRHPDGTNSAYTYRADGKRSSAREAPSVVVTTFVWDGEDYLMEKS